MSTLFFLTLSLLLVAAAPALAQEDGQAEASGDDEAARRAFRLGQAHYDNGDFPEAGTAFEEAFRLSNRPRLLYNAYLAYRDGQDLPNAARTLERFLELSPDLPEHAQLTRRLEAIREAMASQAAGGSGEVAETDQAGESDQISAPEVTGETGETGETGGGETGGTDEGGFNPSPVGFIVAGLGVAMVVGGAITGAMASDDNATLEANCTSEFVCPEEFRATRDRGATLALVTDILLPVGAVAAVAGTVLIFVLQDEPEQNDTQVSAMCTGEGCFGAVTTRF